MRGIVVLELNRPSRLLITEVLSGDGYQVDATESFEQARAALSQDSNPAIIIGACGDNSDRDHFVRSLTQDSMTSAKLIVLLDQDAGSGLSMSGHNAGDEYDGSIVLHIARPLDPEVLIQTIRKQDDGKIDGHVSTSVPREPSSGSEPTKEIALQTANSSDSSEASVPGNAGMDLAAVDDLIELGGREFALEIIEQFVADGARILASIAKTALSADAAGFREQAHALRSCAANVGARGVYSICLDLREASQEQLGANGASYVSSLEQEFSAAAATLREYLDAMMTDPDEAVASMPSADRDQRAAS